MLLSKIKTFFKLLLVNILVFLLVAAVVEVGGQVYFYFHPIYKDNCSTPHKTLGWKLKPNCQFINTGGRYNGEFKVLIKTNSHGFRDKERSFQKSPNTVRIALMGDSMVEALQVPLEKTAAHILETRLNAMSSSRGGVKYEVLNFGVGNHGLGQMFLAYKEFASTFDPDYVLFFVNGYLMERTVEYQVFKNLIESNDHVSQRPRFLLKDGVEAYRRLESNLARSKFLKAIEQEEMIIEYPPQSDVEKEVSSEALRFFLREFFKNLVGDLLSWKNNAPFKIRITTIPSLSGFIVFPNAKILDLAEKLISSERRKLIILDSSKYYDNRENISGFLNNFAKARRQHYVNLSDSFLAAEKKGNRIRWTGDPHFNENGQRVFGETIFNWMRDNFTLL